MLGRDQASILLREFEDREVSEIVLEMVRMDFISEEQQDEILREFAEVAHIANTSKRGGVEFAHEVLEMRLGTRKANEIISRIIPNKHRGVDRTLLPDWDPKSLFSILGGENLQTQALVISYMQPSVSAGLLEQFDLNQRVAIIERMGLMEPLPSEFVEQILTKVRERCHMKNGPEFTRTGGAQSLAQILNSMDEGALKETLAGLQARNPELGNNVKQWLFVFDDIAHLDDRTILEITKNIEMPDLAKALKTAPDGVKEAIFRAFPKRRTEFLKEELENMPAIRVTEVQAVQAKIVQTVNDLQKEGLIHISRFDRKV